MLLAEGWMQTFGCWQPPPAAAAAAAAVAVTAAAVPTTQIYSPMMKDGVLLV